MSDVQIVRMISVEDSPEMRSEDCYPQQLLPARLQPAACSRPWAITTVFEITPSAGQGI